jgi:hypothetical protein
VTCCQSILSKSSEVKCKSCFDRENERNHNSCSILRWTSVIIHTPLESGNCRRMPELLYTNVKVHGVIGRLQYLNKLKFKGIQSKCQLLLVSLRLCCKKAVVVAGTNPNAWSWLSNSIISPWGLRTMKQSCFSQEFKISKILTCLQANDFFASIWISLSWVTPGVT